MSLRLLGARYNYYNYHNYASLNKLIPLAAPTTSLCRLYTTTTASAMSSRPNYQGGHRGGPRGRGGGPNRGGGGGRGRGPGGGRGEQRWWDPVWRAERLRQQATEVI